MPVSNPTGGSPGSGGENLVDYVEVADQAARFVLTTPASLQEGDLVKQLDNGTYWRLKDDSNIGNAAGWKEHFSSAITTLQNAFDNDPIPGIRGKLVMGDSTVPTDFTIPIATNVFWGGSGSQVAFHVGEPDGEISTFWEELFTRAAVDSIPLDDSVDFGVNLSTLDEGLGVQDLSSQFPSLVFAFTDVGLKISAITGVSTGAATDSVAALTPFVGGSILTTDQTAGGTLQCAILKLVYQIDTHSIQSYIGHTYKVREIGASATIRKDDYFIPVTANSVTITLPEAVTGSEYVIYHKTSGITGLVIAPNGGANINGAATLAVKGKFAVATIRALPDGDWIAEVSSVDDNINQHVSSLKVANYPVLATDENIIADTSGGAVTLTLPASPANGQTHRLTLTAFASTLTIGRNGESIDGVAADNTTLLAAARASVTLQYLSAGSTGWVVIASA